MKSIAVTVGHVRLLTPTGCETLAVMLKPFIFALMAAFSAANCGCGTMANLNGQQYPLMSLVNEERPRPLGGVQRDVGWITSVSVPINLFFVLDLPVSLVADFVTLPAVRDSQIRWDIEKENEKNGPRDSAAANPNTPP